MSSNSLKPLRTRPLQSTIFPRSHISLSAEPDMMKQRCSTNRHYELFSLLHVTCNKKKKKKTDQMKEPKNYMFFLLGSYHWFMYLTFLLVTVQFQVCLLRKTGQNKENFKSRRQIDNSTVIWCGHWWFIFLTKMISKMLFRWPSQ